MIGVFDSGVGGLTVVKEIFKHLPKHQIIYFGDTARLPYGTKGAGFVRKYSAKITDWLLKKNAKVIVIACHTSSAWASDYLKNKFKGIPIFEMITPGAKEAVSITGNKKIAIIGTPGTIKSGSWEERLKELDPDLKIYTKACPLFVPLVEEGWINSNVTKEVIKEYLSDLKNKGIDTLILACTHYPILEKTIKEVLGNKINIVNPAESLAKELKYFLKENPQVDLKGGDNHKFFFSDEPYHFKKISKMCFRKQIDPVVKDPF